MSAKSRSAWSAMKVQLQTHLLAGAFIVGVVVLSFSFSAFLCLHFLGQVMEVVSHAQSLNAEVKGTLAVMQDDLFIILVSMAIILSIVILLLFGYFFFRLTGAVFAVNRHIEEKLLQGDLSPVKLRQGDYFQDLAENLNRFVAMVRTEKPPQG